MKWKKNYHCHSFDRWDLLNDAGTGIACIDHNHEADCWHVEWEYAIYPPGQSWALKTFPDYVKTLEERQAYVAALARMS